MKSLLLLLLIVLDAAFLHAQITKQNICDALISELKHPYLFFNETDKAEIIHRIKSDRESNEIYSCLLEEAHRLVNTPVEKFPPQSDHPRYESDGKYDKQISDYSGSAKKLAFLFQLTGEKIFAQKSFEFSDALAGLPGWMIKAHEFTVIYDRVWPWNSSQNDEQVVFSYDIRSAAIGNDMALVYDWCYDAFDQRQRDRIRNALYEKIILPVRNNYNYQWWATSYKCNWCGICFSALGVASLALLTEDPGLTDVIAESYNRINLFLNGIDMDGGWQEGRGYWAYGMGGTIYFMESLRKVTKGSYNLLAHERIQNAPVDFALYGLTGNFADGSGKPVGSTFLINKLVEQTSSSEGAWYRNHFLKNGTSVFDLIWPRPNIKELPPMIPSKHFRTIGWVFMRSDFFNPDYVTVACKAGNNDDPHHGHLDVGQFIVTWQDKSFIRDLGSFAYDEQYFTRDRWNYLYASSRGHNLVYVNGEQQKSAKYKDQAWEQGVGGKILDFRTSVSRDYTLIDPSNAYPGEQMRHWRRHIVFEKPVITLVLDEISCTPGSEIEARFFPGVENVENKQILTLLSDAQNHTMAVIPLCSEKVTIETDRFPFLPVKKEAIMEWVPCINSKITARNQTSILATLIVPVKDWNEGSSIKSSLKYSQSEDGTFGVSFKYKNKSYSYCFIKTPGGLILN